MPSTSTVTASRSVSSRHVSLLQHPVPLWATIVSSAVSAVVAALAVLLVWWLVHRRAVRQQLLREAYIGYSTPNSTPESSVRKGKESIQKESIQRLDVAHLPESVYKNHDSRAAARDPNVRKSLATHTAPPLQSGAIRPLTMSRADFIGTSPPPRTTPSLPPPPPSQQSRPAVSFNDRYPRLPPPQQQLPPPPPRSTTAFTDRYSNRPSNPSPMSSYTPSTHPRSRIQSVRSTMYTNREGRASQMPLPPPPMQQSQVSASPTNPYASDAYESTG